MRLNLALKSVLAFGLAMLAGHYLFVGLSRRDAEAKQPLPGTVANGNTGFTPKLVSTGPTPTLPSTEIDRDFALKNGVWENRNVRMTTQISADYHAGITHTTPSVMGRKISWKPVGQELRQGSDVLTIVEPLAVAETRVEMHGGVKHVVYPNTYESTEEHLHVRPDGGIEHDIILKHQPVTMSESLGLAYSGYLTLGNDLTIWDGTTLIADNYKTKNGISFKNRVGTTVFYLRPAFAYDASVTLRDGSLDSVKQAQPAHQRCETPCEYQLSFDSGKIKLAVVTPGSWLLAPERQYPVTIDPNFGANGLSDGNPPIYIGSVGTGNLIPAFAGGTAIILPGGKAGTACANGRKDEAFGVIPMPFDFTFYPNNSAGADYYSPTVGGPVQVNAGIYPGPNSANGPQADLFVHQSGFATFDPVGVAPYCDEDPCDPTEGPCNVFPNALNNNAALPPAGYPAGGFFALWNDLTFSATAINGSNPGVYWLLNGTAPNQSLVIEWNQMNYAQDSNPNDVISFNLILYECQSVIEVIIGDMTYGDSYVGDSSVGISSPDGSRAVIYDTYAAATGTAGAPTVVTGLAVSFSASPLGTVMTQTTNTMGCIPLYACFLATVDTTIPPCAAALGASAPSYSFHWTFGDGSEAFTANVCHDYTSPQIYTPMLTVTDVSSGAVATYANNLGVSVCDIPPVNISSNPQGGTAPLTVKLTASSTSPFVLSATTPANSSLVPTITTYDTANTAFVVDLQGDQNQPGVFTPFSTIIGGTSTTVTTQANQKTTVDTITSPVTFDTPGTYRVQGVFPATSFGLTTVGTGTIFIDVIDPNSSIANNVIITQSDFHIDWAGKIPNSLGVIPNGNDDTISLSGYINLVGLDLSTLAGQQVTVALNAYNPIFQGTLDVNGKAVQGDASTGQTGSFSVSLPSENSRVRSAAISARRWDWLRKI